MSSQALTVADVKKFLRNLSKSIKLDQIYVDALPRDRFSPMYNDTMWRDWRRDNCAFIGKLLGSADTMSPSRLQKLSKTAASFDPVLVRRVMLDVLADIVGGCLAEPCETAQDFFGMLIGEVERQGRKTKRTHQNGPGAISDWSSRADPLAIAADPECGYDVPEVREHSRPRMRSPAA
jgi:hypothetical protein